MKRIIYFISLFICLSTSTSAVGQKITVSGHLFDAKDKSPLYYASINLEGTPIYDLSDEKGYFELKEILPGKYTMYISILGYQQVKEEIEITKSLSELKYYLNELSLSLDEVVVTAKVSQSKEGSTTYKIDNEAIQQIQPISLTDILQLVPGNQMQPADLSRVAQVDLRNSGGFTNVNAFGTSVIIDGNQLSNDGNMQEDGLNNTANKGIDLREISAANIESVEVISGVASAKHGNITSGAIIVKRKAGYTPWRVSFNNTPNSYQGSVSKGFRLKSGGFLNTDLDYTYNNSNAVSRKRYYQRINTSLRWTKEFSKSLNWNNNLSLSYDLGFDGQREDPDETVYRGNMENQNHNIRFSNNGSLNFLGRFNYNINANYSYQHSLKELPDDGPFPIIESLTEGTFVTTYTPISFFTKTEFFGKPLNFNIRFDTDQNFEFLKAKHSTNIGIEYSFNKNFGEGRVVDEENNTASAMAGNRAMNFHNIPATTIFSAYLQDNISIRKDNAYYLIKLGLRYDYMIQRYHLFAPRLSASAKVFDKFRFRAAYGISYKAPSMLQLYPGPSYFDVINLNHYSEDDARSLAVYTTYIHQPTNEHLEPSKGETIELGVDYENAGFNFRLTGFKKNITNGLYSTSQFMAFQKVIWAATDNGPGVAPDLYATDESIYLNTTQNNYTNNLTIRTTGLEFSAQFPKIEATNTTFNLSGSYLKTYTHRPLPKIRSSASLTSSPDVNRYGVYENPAFNTYILRSNLMIIQHIPQIRMMVTLTCELNLINKYEQESTPSPYPLAYYSREGEYIEIPENERSSSDYDDLYYNPLLNEYEPTPAYFNFHLQIRKETKQGHSFSFYANNFLWYNPVHTNEILNQRIYKNSRITFGIGMNFKL